VGKTTTKEFLSYLLRKKYSVLATVGNLNNHLGVPIMLSRLEPSHQYCVMEMGASHPGEIRALAEIAVPSGGILTPIGPAHLEGFGSLENVYNTKLELADFLRKDDPLVVPESDARLLEKIRQKGRKAITVGYSERAEYRIIDVKSEGGEVAFTLNDKGRFSFPGQASFLAQNAGLAIAMARSLGLAWEEIPGKWEDVGFASGRFRETILPNGVRVIDDSYNANPVSFESALVAFRALPGTGKKIVVFADMLELGAGEERFHAQLGEKIAMSGADLALAYGKRARASIEALESAKTGCVARHFKDSPEVLVALKEALRPGDLVLFKGSRGMHVEKVLDGIRNISFSPQT
jgi:UDP-N-acetylmuramoyl-tripeptide--D-alanyl-D-alanine ligase